MVASIVLLVEKLVEHIFFEKLLHFFGKIGVKLPEAVERRRLPKRYLAAMSSAHQSLRLIGAQRLGLQLSLREVFLPLRLAVSNSNDTSMRWHDIFFQDRHHLLILGEPGTGKSTLLSYLALLFSGRVNPALCEQLGNPFPLFANLRDLEGQPGAGSVLELLNRSRIPAQPKNFAETQIGTGKCIVLLDGLDEILDLALRSRVIEEIGTLAASHVQNWFIVTCRAASWKRDQLHGFQAFEIRELESDDIRRFINDWYRAARKDDEAKLADQRSSLWYLLQGQQELLRAARNPLMLSIITLTHFDRATRSTRVRGTGFPRSRSAIYRECINTFLEWSEKSSPPVQDQKRRVLQAIAYYSLVKKKASLELSLKDLAKEVAPHLSATEDHPEIDKQTIQQTIDEFVQRPDLLVATTGQFVFIHRSLRDYLAASHIVERKLESQLKKNVYSENWREVVLSVVGHLGESAEEARGLVEQLLKREEGAAVSLAALTLAERGPVDFDKSFRQVVLDRLKGCLESETSMSQFQSLASSFIAADSDRACAWFAEQLEKPAETQRQWIVEILPILGKHPGGRFLPKLIQFVENADEDEQLREHAALALAVLGSEGKQDILDALTLARNEIRFPDLQEAATWALCELGGYEKLGLVKIEEGEFRMDDRILHLPSFYIGKFPVTVQEFRHFVEQGRHTPTDKGKDYTKGLDSHPVTWVSWKDALAYARWHGFSLPSEAEWEKAARGTDGRKFPWGSRWKRRRANTREYLKKRARRWLVFPRKLDSSEWTTPVGGLPLGESPYHCHDMAGNVWEWTRSLWGEKLESYAFEYPYVPTDGRENLSAPKRFYRVVRGGSFNHPRKHCQCSYRHKCLPEESHFDVGFRVVSSPPSRF